jgi:hypothetical protein
VLFHPRFFLPAKPEPKPLGLGALNGNIRNTVQNSVLEIASGTVFLILSFKKAQ